MTNEIAIISEEDIKNKIYVIRGKEVMLDSDLAKLYHVETKRINETVKNNQKKFPDKYSWKLDDNESKTFLAENFDQKIETRGEKNKNLYNNLTIKYDDSFHDRFIIIDKIKIYHLGSSLKDLGRKCSYISKFDNKNDIKFICNICYGGINE